jgi:positive regulator of sigma E activity
VVSISIIATVLVLVLHFRGTHGKKVPEWLKSIFFLKRAQHESKKANKAKLSSSNVHQSSKILSRCNSEFSCDNQTIDEICKTIKHACSIFEKRDKEIKTSENIMNEWRELAKRLDSFLLWIFSFVFLFMSGMLFRKIFIHEAKVIRGICECSSLKH